VYHRGQIREDIVKAHQTTVFAALLAATSLTQAHAADPIKIGVVTPLSGTYAGIGQQVRWGLDLAVKEVNAAGGITGRPVELIYEDEEANPRSRCRRPRSCSRSPRWISSPAPLARARTLAVGQTPSAPAS